MTNNYDHKQYLEWMEGQKKEDKVESRLLVETKLSRYWKQRAKRRAKDTKRPWPNRIDRDWAIAQQMKSTDMNQTIQALFEKELENSEGMVDGVDEMMKKIKQQREEMKLKREAVKLMKPQDKVKIKKNLSVATKPEYGGVKKGFDKKRKKLKGPAVAPGESFGPMQEQVQHTSPDKLQALLTSDWLDDPKSGAASIDGMSDATMIAASATLTDYDMAMLYKMAEKADKTKYFRRYWRLADVRKKAGFPKYTA